MRPRLRGLDSTRLLVLVDGERLNTARQATDRTGAEVGLVSPDAISRMEVVNGAGTLMYGSDALAGTINIITNEAAFTPQVEWLYGFNGFYSSNENGLRGTVTLGVTTPRFTVRVQAGAEDFDNYQAGDLDVEDTRPFFASGVLDQADTIDDNFGFRFSAFPDPFNAPYVRTDNEVPNSQARGNFVNVTGRIKLGERRSVRVRYQRRRMEDVGFPDFAAPYFFNATSLPHSNLDKVSARYEAQAVTPWLANLSLTAYYQRTERLLQNLLPVQFPAPTAVAFFPISVMRLDVLSETEQRVWTPGVDLQAVLRARDQSPADDRPHVLPRPQQRSTHHDAPRPRWWGRWRSGRAGRRRSSSRAPVQLGPPSTAHPVRVPDASFRGHRGVRAGRVAAAARTCRWSPACAATSTTSRPRPRRATTSRGRRRREAADRSGDAAGPERRDLHPPVADRRHRPGGQPGRHGEPVHPLRAQLPPSEPRGDAVCRPGHHRQHRAQHQGEAGDRQQLRRRRQVRGRPGLRRRLLLREPVPGLHRAGLSWPPRRPGPLAQAINYADVRISGLEFSADAPILVGRGVLTLATLGAFTRGTITEGVDPLDGESLDGTPADNITPSKVVAAARFTEPRGRWWAEYGVRGQGEVTRVAETLLESPFLIAQDLLSLDGFAVQRLGWGVNLTRGRDRAGRDLRGREPDRQVLPRAVPVRAGARPELHRRAERGSVLRQRRQKAEG